MTRLHFLDTSALVKLVVYPDLKLKEKGSETLAEYRKNHYGFYTIELCVGEALNVLKQKAFSKDPKRKQLSWPDGYLICVERLLCFVRPRHTIHLIPLDISTLKVRQEIHEMVNNYHIDFVDAVVLSEAKRRDALLITADTNLEKAARDHILAVWNCSTTTAPLP